MTAKEKANFIIKDLLINHLPRVQEGLQKGYVDENQILVMYDHAVRARVLQESDGERIARCPQCFSPTVQPRDSNEYCEQCGWPNENRPA